MRQYTSEKNAILALVLNLLDNDNLKQDLDIEVSNVTFDNIVGKKLDNGTFEGTANINIEFEINIGENSKTFEIDGEGHYMNEDTYDISFIENNFSSVENEIKSWINSL